MAINLKEDTNHRSLSIAKGIEGVSVFLFKLCQVAIVLLVVVVFLCGFMRYGFNMPVYWSTEVSEYILVFVVFMGAAGVMVKKGHIEIEIFLVRFGRKKRLIIDLFILILSLFWCVVMDWLSWKTTWNAYKYGIASFSLLRFPIYISYSFLSIGLTILVFQLFSLLIKRIHDISHLKGGKI